MSFSETSRLFSSASLALLLAGCYTIEFHETTYPVALTPVRTGPGGAEGELFECVVYRRDAYSGEKMSVGLFPGHPYFLESLDAGVYGGTACYAIWVPIGNVFFALPTICSLLVEPFVQTDPNRTVKDLDILSLGLVGAFRWKTLGHVEDEEAYRERAVVNAGYKVNFSVIPKMKADDGTLVFFAYPGFRALKRAVDENDAVDVVFPDGSKIRRFCLSENAEDRLVYEDRDLRSEPAVFAQFPRYCEWTSLLLQVKRLAYAKGYSAASAGLKSEISAFESEVETVVSIADAQSKADLKAYRERLEAFSRALENERIE